MPKDEARSERPRKQRCPECHGYKTTPQMVNYSKQGGWDGVTWAYWKELCDNDFHKRRTRR